jgi:hypothetical protein
MFASKAGNSHGSEAGFGKKRCAQPAVLHGICDKHAWLFTPGKHVASRDLPGFLMLHDSNLSLFDTPPMRRITPQKQCSSRACTLAQSD